MKSQKGVALTSIIVYIVVLLVVISVISIISSFFYKNIKDIGSNVDPSKEIARFNSLFINDLNREEIEIKEVETNDSESVVVLSDGTQYTFKNGGIYRDKVKVCSDIYNMNFEKISNNEVNVKYQLKKDDTQISSNYNT